MPEATSRDVEDKSPLAMIIGGGSIPMAVADAVTRRGRRVVLFPVRGWADPAAVEKFTHYWIPLAQAGRFRRHLMRGNDLKPVILENARDA